ncbi:MAG: hypothetical protein PHP46_05060 [Candidatus Omnitrophica bacterium]|nr:hypothetical protein [Candidatus Omnitrophota bacterium]
MNAKYRRSMKKVRLYNDNMDVFIERLRKVRALNSDPALSGIDNGMMKRFSFHKVELSTLR